MHDRGLPAAIFIGIYKTNRRFPMLIAGPCFAPMMFNEPGIGCHVVGELYEVDAGTMAKLDQIESVGRPGNLRVQIDIEPCGGGPTVSAFVFMKTRQLAEPAHTGYLELYDDWRFMPPEDAGLGRR